MPNPDFEPVELSRRRVCRRCEQIYTIAETWEQNESYFKEPYDYQSGCQEYCLGCWLGVGDLDTPEGDIDACETGESDSTASSLDRSELPTDDSSVDSDEVDEGDLLERFRPFLDEGFLLAVMPISRVFVEWFSITYRDCFTFLPPGLANLDSFNIIPNRESDCPLAEAQSAASGVNEELLNQLTLVAFPCRVDWNSFRKTSHDGHLDLIRQLSESVDRACLDFARYCLCGFEPVDTLPGRAGQLESNPMMAGLCLFNPVLGESRVVGGAAFTHTLTRGLGLALESIDSEEFPRDGEVGHVVQHALSLYSAAIEGATATSRFVQALSLLEFLAYPDEYRNFQDVKKVIARYHAKDRLQYESLLDRFHMLTGKKDENGKTIGFRTRAVHMGERLEQMIPDLDQRSELFRELDCYIRAVLHHMIEHSELPWNEYLAVRETLRPFDR